MVVFMWFETFESFKSFDCLTCHQQLGLRDLSNWDIISAYTCVLFGFFFSPFLLHWLLFDVLTPFIISVFIMQGFWLRIINLWVRMNFLQLHCRNKDILFCLSRWALGTWDEIYDVHRGVVAVPWHSSPPETPPDIFLFFLLRVRIVWCVRVSINNKITKFILIYTCRLYLFVLMYAK